MHTQKTTLRGQETLSNPDLQAVAANPDRLVPDRIAGEIVGISVATLRRWRYEGRGPRYAKVGSSVRYKISWLLEFVDAGMVEPHADVQTRRAEGIRNSLSRRPNEFEATESSKIEDLEHRSCPRSNPGPKANEPS
jgi:hypothetical protein